MRIQGRSVLAARRAICEETPFSVAWEPGSEEVLIGTEKSQNFTFRSLLVFMERAIIFLQRNFARSTAFH